MRVLLIHGQHNRDAKALATNHYHNVLCDTDDIIELEKLNIHTIESGKEILESISMVNYDIVHVVYDNNMFIINHDRRVVFTEFTALMTRVLDSNKKLVITMDWFKLFTPRVKTRSNWWYNKQIKWLNQIYYEEVLPLLKRAELVVTTYDHELQLSNIGIHGVHVIPQPGCSINYEPKQLDQNTLKIVVPGARSNNIDYNEIMKILCALNSDKTTDRCYKLHICNRDEEITDDHLIKLIVKHNVTEHVQFIQFSNETQQYIDQLASYDVAVILGKQLSRSVIDALAAELICITSNTPSNKIFKLQHNCIYTTDAPNTTIPYYINQLIDDKSRLSELQNNIRKYKERVQPSSIKKMYELVYEPRDHVKPQELDVTGVINVFMCCRDNEQDLGTTLSRLRVMERRLNGCEFKYYILENDSVDDTPNIIKDFFASADGVYVTGAQGNNKHISAPGVGRMRDMADYRNHMKSLCDSWDNSNYSFIVDSGVEFELDIMERQLYQLLNNDDVAMITPYGVIQTSNFYYDNFAYRNLQDTRDFDLSSTEELFEVHSAFCGFVCIRTSVLERCNWDMVDGETCEHVPFCKQVRKHGKIVIDPTVVVRWRP